MYAILLVIEEKQLTNAIIVVILVPPDAPFIKNGSPLLLTNIAGVMDDMGILPGTMKLDGEAGTPKALVVLGVEKSSISSLKIIPVLLPLTLDPKLWIYKIVMITARLNVEYAINMFYVPVERKCNASIDQSVATTAY